MVVITLALKTMASKTDEVLSAPLFAVKVNTPGPVTGLGVIVA
jgi:hypothetical protein